MLFISIKYIIIIYYSQAAGALLHSQHQEAEAGAWPKFETSLSNTVRMFQNKQQIQVAAFYKYKTIAYFLYSYSYSFIKKKGSRIQTNSHQNLKRYSKSLVAVKKKESHSAPPVCYLSNIHKGRGRGRGRMPAAGKLIYLVYKVVHTQTKPEVTLISPTEIRRNRQMHDAFKT